MFSYQDGIFKDKSSNPFVWEGLFILPTVSFKEGADSQYHLELSFYGNNVFDVSVEKTITTKLPIFFKIKIGSTARPWVLIDTLNKYIQKTLTKSTKSHMQKKVK